MNKFWVSLIAFIVAGMFIAPPYEYTSEQAAQRTGSGMADWVTWPIRAYENWSACGTIGYCEAVRCAALRGGCNSYRPSANVPDDGFPVRSINHSEREWQAKIKQWCEDASTTAAEVPGDKYLKHCVK